MSGEVVQIVIDNKFVVYVAGSLFLFSCFLVTLMFKMALNGLNKTIKNSHHTMATETTDLKRRVHDLEDVVYRRSQQ